MAKFILIILASFSISTDVLFGGEICNDYNDKGCIHHDTLKDGYYENKWSVSLPGLTKKQARKLLEDNGFDYLGQIMNGVDLHLVTKKGTIEKHVKPNAKIIELLGKIKQVHAVAQKHVFQNLPNEVFSVYNENRVEYQAIDPDTIILDDGRLNLERIKTDKASIISNSRPTSSTIGNNYNDIKQNDNDMPDEQLMYENLLNMNLSELESLNALDNYLIDDDIDEENNYDTNE